MPSPRPAVLSAIIVLAGCGVPPPPSPATATAPPPVATVEQTAGLQPSDIGADVVGCSITVPPMHELELAYVAIRDGAISPADCHLASHATGRGETVPCRLISFRPQGPLRPDAHDLLLLADGWQLRHAETQRGSTTGHGVRELVPGAAYVEILEVSHGGPSGGWSSDVHSPGDVALGMHVYARLRAVIPGHRRWAELSANPQASYTSSGPLPSPTEVIGPAPGAPANPSF